jgi:hypothetical protein
VAFHAVFVIVENNEKRSGEQLSSTVIASASQYFFPYRMQECHCHKSPLGLPHQMLQCILNLTECTSTTPVTTYPRDTCELVCLST